MNKTSISVLALVVGMIIGAMLTGFVSKEATLAGVTISDETFVGDVTVGNDLTVAKDLILSDNDFCINFFATSTATQIKMVASTTIASGSNIGVMTMQYGSCLE